MKYKNKQKNEHLTNFPMKRLCSTNLNQFTPKPLHKGCTEFSKVSRDTVFAAYGGPRLDVLSEKFLIFSLDTIR